MTKYQENRVVEYQKANMDDVGALVQIRYSFLCEVNRKYEEDGRVLIENIKKYYTEGIKSGSFAIFTARCGDKIVATGGLSFFSLPPSAHCPNGKTAYLSNMYTLPEYRGQGIGTRMFALLADEAAQNGCERIMLHATEQGRGIYEKFGFKQSDNAMIFYPFDAV